MPPICSTDYAYSKLERFWASDEPTFQVGTQPTADDAVIALPGASVPMIAPEYVPSEERNPTPGIRQTFARKKQPSEFELPMYLRMPQTGGDVPSWGLLAQKAFGLQSLGTYATITTALATPNSNLRFIAKTPGTGGNSIVVGYAVAGTSTPLSVSVTGSAITVNVATDGGGAPSSTANAVMTALRASADAAALILVQRAPDNSGVGVVAAGSFTLTGGAATGQISYIPDTCIEEDSFSLHHWMGNEIRHIRGCLINELTIALSGSAEGRLTFTGLGTNESFAGISTLAQALDNSSTTVYLTDAQRFLAFGLEHGDTVRIQIDDEILLLVDVVDEVTGECEVQRGIESSTPASHAGGADVLPYALPEEPAPDEVIASGVLGTVTFDGQPWKVIEFEVTLNNGLEARLDEYGEPAATGYRRAGPRTVTGTFRAYALKAQKGMDSALERNREYVAVVTAGESTTAIALMYFSRFKIRTIEPAGDGPEFIKTYTFDALERNGNDELILTLA